MKCDHCPIKDGECVSQRPGWEFACKLAADGGNAQIRWIVDHSGLASGKPLPVARPTAYPPLVVQATNLVKSAVQYVASGCATVDQAEYDRRRGICSGCEHFDAEQDRCRVCGCAMSFKPWGLAMKCPEGKW
jgi:hypothetical protein